MKTWKTTRFATALVVISMLGNLPISSAAEEKIVTNPVAKVKIPADHKAAAVFYRKESDDLQQEANQQAELAKKLVGETGDQSPSVGHHHEQAEYCRRFADLLEKAAQEAQSLAKFHEDLAQVRIIEKTRTSDKNGEQ
ncbi:MAG: hypothetical protein HY267_07105 [Deltaproteobacteria bacterium]|nr:hypothetical protein [Deltaproteobacteria bacterium]